ncbi:MAG: ligase-associated DNA damage response DEXH box helicase [Hyphomicrobiaceae bacterium]
MPRAKALASARPRRTSLTSRPGHEVALPPTFARWFGSRGWQPRAHQIALIEKAGLRRSCLLIAPTGAGKTLAGFLPSLIELSDPARAERRGAGLHTLYVSPLKALAVDIARNLEAPVAEMGLPIRVETRTGDTGQAKRQRQRVRPPDMLLTTPEQIALLLSHDDAHYLFADLRCVILDELHALGASKRGDLLSLGLARLRTLAPDLVGIGLSATVARPSELRAYLAPQDDPDTICRLADLVVAAGGAAPDIRILETEDQIPWAGHTTRYAVHEILAAIKAHRLSLVFVNTRMQAELLFQELWRINEDNLAIALHHGSLDAGQRRKVEAAMAAGRLSAVVCTSTLDLGIDWGDVDLVINVGAPKGASRLTQRIGRANHRLDEPSQALLVPSNRFEVLECRAAMEAAEAGQHDVSLARAGTLDVLAQHVMGTAVAGPFLPDDLFREVRTAAPYSNLARSQFDRVVDYVATGGYALRSYERFARLRPMEDGRLRLAHPRLAQPYRLNVGTIVEAPKVRIRLVRPRGLDRRQPGMPGDKPLQGGRMLGEVEEDFIGDMAPGDTFVFAGEVVRFEGQVGLDVFVSRAAAQDPKVPSYAGGKFPLSTHLAARVRAMLADPGTWRALPGPVAEWLTLQEHRSELPSPTEVLVETFPRATKHYLVAYPFEGRLAHQTLGMLLTRRLDRAGANPLGFVANDYGLSIWSLNDVSGMIAAGRLSLEELFDEDMLGDDLEAWLAESSLMRRTFRMCAMISGLIERRHPGQEKSSRQLRISSDLIYNVLRQHDPHHILLEAAWVDAATGLLDIRRLSDFLSRVRGRIRHLALDRVSPLAVPILLEIGRESVGGGATEALLREAAEDLIAEATR